MGGVLETSIDLGGVSVVFMGGALVGGVSADDACSLSFLLLSFLMSWSSTDILFLSKGFLSDLDFSSFFNFLSSSNDPPVCCNSSLLSCDLDGTTIIVT